MVDKELFLEYLNEFSELIGRKENEIYREGERRLDYLGLMLLAVIGAPVGAIAKGEPHRITWVYSELSEMLQPLRYDDLLELKTYVENGSYAVRVTPGVHETTFVVRAEHYDLNIIIEPL